MRPMQLVFAFLLSFSVPMLAQRPVQHGPAHPPLLRVVLLGDLGEELEAGAAVAVPVLHADLGEDTRHGLGSNAAVHGRYGQPCPRCGEKILRIRYADNETNYCARCQTGGRVLADRSLSRLLHSDWPRTLEELESLKRR